MIYHFNIDMYSYLSLSIIYIYIYIVFFYTYDERLTNIIKRREYSILYRIENKKEKTVLNPSLLFIHSTSTGNC